MAAEKPPDSGTLQLQDDVIRYCFGTGADSKPIWELPVAALCVMGEYTNDHGPYADDYFLVFVGQGIWCEASFYAQGRDALLKELEARLQTKIELTLQWSTDLRSRVLWPPALRYQLLWDVSPRRPGWRLWEWLVPISDLVLTEEVRRLAHFAPARPEAPSPP